MAQKSKCGKNRRLSSYFFLILLVWFLCSLVVYVLSKLIVCILTSRLLISCATLNTLLVLYNGILIQNKPWFNSMPKNKAVFINNNNNFYCLVLFLFYHHYYFLLLLFYVL